MRLCNLGMYRLRWLGLLAGCIGTSIGCHRGPEVVPVEGIVYYNDAPLPFGSVMFQPQVGQPAGARLNKDGTFKLSTFSEFDGAIVGNHKVKVTCYASQNPLLTKQKTVGEQTLGPLLIPDNYTYSDQSGLTADVKSDENEPFEFRLTGPPVKFPK